MTSLGWLWLLLGFALPLFAFFVVSAILKWKPGFLAMAAGGAALIPIVTLWFIIFSSPYWHDGTQVVWTGVSTTSPQLALGGKAEDMIIGWPNEAQEPRINLAPASSPSQATMEIKGGEAFVLEEPSGRPLNGKPLGVGEVLRLGDYQIKVNRLGLSLRHLLSHEIEILDANGNSLAGFALRPNRTRSLRYLLAGTPMELAGTDDQTQQAQAITGRHQLEEWAEDIRLFRSDDDRVYVLSQADEIKVTVKSPAMFSVKWPGTTQKFSISTVNLPDGLTQTQANFQPTWRLASPLPPARLDGCEARQASPPGDLTLTVTGSVRPCDVAFVLPVGAELSELRHDVSILSSTGQFTGGNAVDNENRPALPPGVAIKRENIGTSQLSVNQGAYSFNLATVRNLPSRFWTLMLALFAWAIYAAGLVLVLPRLGVTSRIVAYGLSLVAWTFLSFRLLLSFRYALDPASLDQLAVRGVTLAFIGLCVVPGLLLLVARLRSDRYDGPLQEEASRRAMFLALTYLGILVVGGLVSLSAASRLWTDLPKEYSVSFFDYLTSRGSLVFTGFLAVAAIAITLHIRYLYLPDDPKGESKGVLARLFVSPWYWVERYFAESNEFWETRLRGDFKRMLFYFLGGCIVFIAYIILFWLTRLLLPGDKTAQEFSVPLLFIWLTLLWLGLRVFFITNDKPLEWRSYLMLAASAVLMITAPAVLLPASIGDFGSIIPILALILPLTWLLIVILPTRARLCVALALALIFGGGLILYQNVEGLIPFEKQIASVLPAPVQRLGSGSRGRLFARLLNYKQGTGAQRLAVNANSIVGGEGLPYQELLNGNQHTWENRALAHAGDLWGLGFGAAPTRRSHIRQDTLQYDSVFSVFIASEFGMVGGALLLLMYAVPLIFIFAGGRSRFDGGYALAFIIASAFLLEGLYHAGMNTGAFPMTGRNLPLLSVNSPTDLIRWTILFILAITATFWRHKGQGSLNDQSPSLISERSDPAAAGAKPPQLQRSSANPGREPLLKYSLVFWVVPVCFAAAVLYSGLKVLTDPEDELTTYDYTAILEDVDYYLQNGVVRYDTGTGRLQLNQDMLEDPDVRSFIQEEIIRFNAEDRMEREERFGKAHIEELNSKLSGVTTLQQYNAALRELGLRHPPTFRANVFRLRSKIDEEGEVTHTEVEPNPDFNISFSFQSTFAGRGMPQTRYGKSVIIGPAWVSGRVRAVMDPDGKLPWLARQRNATMAAWSEAVTSGVSVELAQSQYGALTLDPVLHEAAQNFAAVKGLRLHESLLASGSVAQPNNTLAYIKKLPKRVALSVLDLTNGKTLALGGWPRMTSTTPHWSLDVLNTPDGERSFWLPSEDWLEKEAPVGFLSRYGGDRNFERSLVMGSSTKPIWAAAVLKTHPKLAENLLVRGAGGSESTAFGVRLPGKEWQLNSHTTEWIDFSTYLKTSDNRYHVRLGLAGLAQDADGALRSAGQSPSTDESLSGGPNHWGFYPAFVTPIQVGGRGAGGLELLALGPEGQPNLALANSPLAQNLRGMFSIGISRVIRGETETREFGPRRSFWTKDENDDVAPQPSRALILFGAISPQAPDFAFDRLTRPRDYITMLLGGGNNLWSNVDLAAAFGSCLLGRPMIAHVVDNPRPVKALEGRKLLDPAIAQKLRPGLRAVAESEGGTAYKGLHTRDAVSYLLQHGVRIYAKTGTLRNDERSRDTSRIVLALVRWKNEAAGEVEAGLVFSLVVEEGGTGTAPLWLGEFLLENRDEISRLLNIETTPATAASNATSR
jgi:cell division protein FtsW (lipid II flippase)/cell division protein FtsI/penicillin-binding protein 2